MPFTAQNFKDGVGPAIKAAFLNNLDQMVNNTLGGTPTVPAVQAALGIPSGGVPVPITATLGGTGSANGAGTVISGGADTGTANTYVIPVTAGAMGTPAALATGQILAFTAANPNSGASTIAAGGTAATAVIGQFGGALVGGEILPTDITLVRFNGTNWQIITQTAPFVRNAAEIAAGVQPVNPQYFYGWDLRYGVVRDDATDNQTALTNMIAVGAQGQQLVLTNGVARHSGTLNWGFSYLKVTAVGKSQFRHTGAGAANTIITAGASFEDISLTGYIEELGNANTTYGWDISAVARSRLDIRSKNANTAGARVLFAVACDIRYACTSNDVSFTTTPPIFLILDERGEGEFCSWNQFYNTMLEGGLGTTVGLSMGGCFGNAFFGGTSESNGTGILINNPDASADCYENAFYNWDMEQNLVSDLTITNGRNNKFYSSNFGSTAIGTNVTITAGDTNGFFGGYVRSINYGANQVQLVGVQTLSGGFTGTGPAKIIGCTTISGTGTTTGVVNDDIGEKGTFTPTISGATTPGTQTYGAATGGWYQRVGHLVVFTLQIVLTANGGGAAGTAILGGLPFSTRNISNLLTNFNVNDYTGITLGAAGRTLSVTCQPGVTTGALLETDTASVHNPIAITSVAATATLVISGSYLID